MKEIEAALQVNLGIDVVFQQEENHISFVARTQDIICQKLRGKILQNGDFSFQTIEDYEDSTIYHIMRERVKDLFNLHKEDIIAEIKKDYQDKYLSSLKERILEKEKELQTLKVEFNILQNM